MGFVGRTKRAVGYGLTKDDEDQKVDNEEYLYDLLGSIPHGVLNGSFENLDGSDPSNMTISLSGPEPPTGSYAIDEDNADVRHGFRSLSMTTADVDDIVQLDWDDYTPCAPGERIEVDFQFKLTAATLTLKVELLWYYWNGSAFTAATTASTTLYDDSTTNPTSWSTRKLQAMAPSGANPARYYRVRMTFGKASAATTGTVHIDGLESRVYHGFVPADMSDANAILSTSTGTSQYITLPSAILGDERAHTAALYIELTWDVAGSQTITISESGNTNWYIVRDSSVFGNPSVFDFVTTRLDSDMMFRFQESGAGNLTAVRIILVGYWV